MFVDALTAAGADVELITGIPHYPEWRLKDDRYRRGVRWREQDGAVPMVRVRHAVPSGANFVGRMRLETSFAALSAPFVWSSSARVIVAVTPAVGAVLAAHAGRRGRPLGVIVHDLTGNAAVQSGTTSSQVAKMVGAAEYASPRAREPGRRDHAAIRARPRGPWSSAGPHRRIADASHVVAADLTPEQARRKLGWESRGLTVVHTGNMGMKQGLEHVMAAARVAVRGICVSNSS